MADMQKQVDTAFAELDIIEEMLRPLVAAKEIHQLRTASAFPSRKPKSSSSLAGC